MTTTTDRAQRQEEVAVLALRIPGRIDTAWREASYLLFYRWLDHQGATDFEGQPRTALDEPPWSWLRT